MPLTSPENPCQNAWHGSRVGAGAFVRYLPTEPDPDCQTCSVRAMLDKHDHLHLGGEPCDTPGIGGTPGVNVPCSCGAYHH